MDSDLAVILIGIGLIIGIVVAVIVGAVYIDIMRYSDKCVTCTEDYGVSYTAKTTDRFIDFFWYFSYDSSAGLKFKGTDGRLYSCRGTAVFYDCDLKEDTKQ